MALGWNSYSLVESMPNELSERTGSDKTSTRRPRCVQSRGQNSSSVLASARGRGRHSAPRAHRSCSSGTGSWNRSGFSGSLRLSAGSPPDPSNAHPPALAGHGFMMPISEARNLLAWLVGLIVLLAAAPVYAQKELSKKSGREGLTIDPATMMQPWKGDL